MVGPAHSLNKALNLLEAIAKGRGDISLTALAAELKLPLSTAHRLAATLEAQGFIVREKRGYYHPGLKLLNLAAAADFNRILTRVSRPYLKSLAQATGQTVHLGVYEGDMVTYLAKEGGHKLFTQSGMQLEAYCTGIGKCLLAHMKPTELEHYLAGGPFIRLTPNTITEPADLCRELLLTRTRGYAIDNAEMDDSIKCIAVALADHDGTVRAALSVTTLKGEFTKDFDTTALAKLQSTAAGLKAHLFPAAVTSLG